MNKIFFTGILLAGVCAVSAVGTNELSTTLQRGLFEEEANHNLNAAIQAYEAVVNAFDKDRKLAATAAFRLGECYRKQNKSAEARAQYERVVRDFSEQSVLVEQSRKALGQNSAPPIAETAQTEDQLIPLFNGHDLSGWTYDEAYWSIEGGYITGKAGVGAPQQLLTKLVANIAVDDFELHLKYRFRKMAGNAQASAGIEYRIPARQNGNGYQYEVTLSGDNVGMLTQRDRPVLAILGQRAKVAPRATNKQDRVEVIETLQQRPRGASSGAEDWNECTIIAKGNHLIHKINGDVVADLVDENEARRSFGGAIALVLNTGAKPAVYVQFKDLELRRLTPGSTATAQLPSESASNDVLLHLEKLRVEAKAEVLQLQTLLEHLKSLQRHELRQALPIAYPDPQLSELLVNLAAANAKLDSVAVDLGREHPEYKKADAVVGRYEKQVDEKIAGTFLGIETRLSSLKARLTELERQISEAKAAGSTRTAFSQRLVSVATKPTTEPSSDEEAAEVRRIQAIVKDSPDLINARSQTASGTYLHNAAQNGLLKVAQYFLENGADVNITRSSQDGSTPLHLAAESGHKTMIELLVRHHADVNANGFENRTPLWLAADHGFKSIVEFLLANGANVNAANVQGDTPLHRASENGFKAIMELLIKHKADVNARNALSSLNTANSRAGFTPLHLAASRPPDVAELLLANGADVNAQAHNAVSPLHTAVSRKNIAVAELLIKHNAAVNATNSVGATPLHLAAEGGSVPIAQLLLSNRANTEARDQEGRTPLYYCKTKEMLQLLLDNGANVNALNKYNTTLYDVLWSNGASLTAPTQAMLDLIKQRGAKRGEEILRPQFISFSRNGARYKTFYKGTNGLNEYTLFELLAGTDWSGQSRFKFPDFSRITINRINPGANATTELHVDVQEALKSGDCAKDIPLQGGDVVEIPEMDHPVGQGWMNIPAEVQESLTKCLTRTVEVEVKGQTNKVVLKPALNAIAPYAESPALERFYLHAAIWPFVRTSSDLKRVHVRRKLSSGEIRDIVVNLDPAPMPDLFLRDGDVIEIPEKP